MSNMWHNYFDENDVETWSIYKFHKNWNCIHGGEPGRNYCKSADALAKSLRAIVNKSPDTKKIKKANKLLSDLQSLRANENINRLRKKRMNNNNIDTGTNCLQFSSCSDVRIESVESVSAPKRRKNLSLSKKNKEIVDLTEDTSDRKRKTQGKESVKKRARAETTEVDGDYNNEPDHQRGNTSPSSRPSCVVDSTFKSDTIDTTTDTAIYYNNELDHQRGNTSPPSRPSCVVDSTFKSDTIDTTTDTAIYYNNELDKWAKETTLQRKGEWIIGTNEVNVRDLLTLWQNEKKRPHNDLAYYDIIDVTPGTNSDFVKKRSKDEFEEMMKYGSPIPDIDNSDIKELIVEMIKEPDFHKAVENNFLSTRNDDRKKFAWDFAYQLANSFERGNDLLNENLSERMYREVFFTPIMRSLFQKLREDMKVSFGEISLFASAEDYDLTKNDEEDRSSGRKTDIVWTTLPKLEFAIGEVSGPPNQHQHPHFFGDKLKIAKMLKVMFNRIVRVYGGVGESLSLLKLYGLQIYDHTTFIYELTVPYRGLYVYREVQRFQLPTNRNNVVLLCRSVLKFLLFKEMLIKSLDNLNTYIMEAGLHTPTENNSASLFVTQMSYTPKKKNC